MTIREFKIPTLLAFCSIYSHLTKFGILYLPQSPIIGQNSDGIFSDFRISRQFLVKENFNNSRTSDAIDMKLGAVTKIDKRNKTTSKKFDVDVMSWNCDAFVIFFIFGQFGAVQGPDSGYRLCNSYVFSYRTFCLTKNVKRTKKSLTQLLHYCLE